MKNLLVVIGAILFCYASVARCQSHADITLDSMQSNMALDDLISRFDDEGDTVMKCETAIQVFRKEYERHPTDAFAALYFARTFDKAANVGGACPPGDSSFLAYCDSALKYFKIAEKLMPGIRERRFKFPVPVMIGHLYGTRCCWWLKHGEYEKAVAEMAHGKAEGGYTPAQIELCRLMMDFCDTGSILFTAGDDDTFSAMYLQMVEGYRPDLSVINTSLACMKWYDELFLGKPRNGFTPVKVRMTKKQLDSLDLTNGIFAEKVPDRLYTDVSEPTRKRLHRELGIDVADRAEICFPVYRLYEGRHYTLAADIFIASVLQENKWKRRVFFSSGGLHSSLECTHVAIRESSICDELYPINLGQAASFMKDNKWYYKEKMKNLIFHDVNMEKFTEDKIRTSSQVMMYYSLTEYLYFLDSGDQSAKVVIRKLQSISPAQLEGYEASVLPTAQAMYRLGFKEEAKQTISPYLGFFKNNLSGAKKAFGDAETQYILALIMSGDCQGAVDFVNSFDVTAETKESALQELRTYYGCK
ncbi:MAG: hypothetical protein Q8896_09260 [Bacteroidota bacterium]|nr:hypothetical protein [Bacteroidota bacterium]MDP4236444.1 hypothetical protein [Bacteroidota bacterium]